MPVFRLEAPNWISVPMAVNAAELTGGLFFSDYLASTTALAANLTGNAALAAKTGVKSVLGIVSFAAASRAAGGELQEAAYFISIGSFASIGMDLLQKVWGSIWGGPGGQAASATLGKNPVTVSPPRPIGSSPEEKKSSGTAV